MPADLTPLYREQRGGVERWFIAHGWRTDAADLTQESFLRLHRCYRPGPATPKTVLYVIARNLAIDESRRRHVPTVPLELVGDLPAYASDPARAYEAKDALRCLVTALLALPEPQRQAWTLKHFLGLSGVEVADALGVSEIAARALVHRAAVTLRRRLREDDAA